MGFQTAFAPGLTLPDQLIPSESDSESVNSTIPTKNQLKRSKNAEVRLVNNNDKYHLVSSSSNTQLMRLVADFERKIAADRLEADLKYTKEQAHEA